MGLGLALLIGYEALRPKEHRPFVNGDDQPILVSGGSLTIRGAGKWATTGDDLLHQDDDGNESSRYIGGIDLVYVDGSSLPAFTSRTYTTSKLTILMTYCEDQAFGTCETVSIITKNGAQGLRIKAPSPHKAKDDDVSVPHTVKHLPTTGFLKDVTLPGDISPLSCGLGSRCVMVIHYCATQGCS
jgi:hypothetical protein